MWVDRGSNVPIGGMHWAGRRCLLRPQVHQVGKVVELLELVRGGGTRDPLERSHMVDPAGWDEGKLPHTGHTPRYPPISVEGKEWARREMECVIGAHQDPLWAEATLRNAKGVVESG